jgi:hypothetical protein
VLVDEVAIVGMFGCDGVVPADRIVLVDEVALIDMRKLFEPEAAAEIEYDDGEAESEYGYGAERSASARFGR